ncbi:hypothetical protein FRC00_000524 [Tulasnella sp. 408]|nr:hypothetical protein FRC00_000524 [Tulasnella sp. 408]
MGTITTDEGSKAFHKAFQMAKDSLLDVIFIDEGEIEASQFFSLTGDKMNQWRSLSVESNSMADVLANMQAQWPPKLDMLHLDAGYVDPSGEEEIVLFGGTPAVGLKDIRLTRVPINPASLQLSSLKSLHLNGITAVTATEVIQILADSPTLEILRLNELHGADLPTGSTTTKPDLSFGSAPLAPSFIPFLGRPTTSPPSESSIWLLPQLEIFESNLAWTDSHNEIVDMIKRRHAVGTKESSPELYEASPKRFREIRLANPKDRYPIPSSLGKFMSDVVQAAEGADVYWQGRRWTE